MKGYFRKAEHDDGFSGINPQKGAGQSDKQMTGEPRGPPAERCCRGGAAGQSSPSPLAAASRICAMVLPDPVPLFAVPAGSSGVPT